MCDSGEDNVPLYHATITGVCVSQIVGPFGVCENEITDT